MATLYISLGRPKTSQDASTEGLLIDARARKEVAATVTASSAVVSDGSASLTAQAGEVWCLTADAAMRVSCGDAPEAGVTPGFYLAAGLPYQFAAGKDGEEIAAMTV